MSAIYSFLDNYLPICINPIIVEIGAAQAEDTPRIIANLRGDWTYYAFEPDPRGASIFRSSIIDSRVIFTEAAISSFTGVATLHIARCNHPPNAPDLAGASSLRRSKRLVEFLPWFTFERTCEVPVITLDDFFANRNVEKIDFLWCDAQGSERDILLGASKMLPKIAYLYMEYSNHEMYEGQGLYSDLLEAAGPDFEEIGQWNGPFEGDILLRNKKLAK